MERIVDVAQYLIDRYFQRTGENLDEMKLHKLLYFCQREMYMMTGRPLFAEKMQAWRLGPVCPLVRQFYLPDGKMACATRPLSDESIYVVNNAFEQYASISSWRLSEMSHAECSWQRARKGLPKGANCQNELSESDIREDARKIRPYDALYDMYIDEFETEDSESVAK